MPRHFGHLLQVPKTSLQPLTLYTSFHDLINVYSWQPPGDKILMSSETSCYFGHLLQVSKKSIWSLILYTGLKILYQHFGDLLQVPKQSLQPLTLYTSFHDLVNVYSRRSGADNLQGDKILMSTETSCHFGHLLQISKKSLWSLILYTFFHDFIHVYSLTTPWGWNYDVNRNILSLRSSVASFKRIPLKSVRFCTIVFMILYTVYSTGARADSPQGTSFDVNRNVLSLHSFVASLKTIF